jgi:transcriptional regulator GlxA family with amidase domain
MATNNIGTITQISQSCGFGSASFFGKTFRAGLGMTPSAYRRKWQDTAK